MSQGRNICFYSNKDKWSKTFIEELSKTPWVREFEFICVDASPNRPSLPKWLKQVPTLVINGDDQPIKTDTEVMNWLYERKMKETPKKQTATVTPEMGGEPQSWIGNEMKGFGNSGYSFVDSDTSTGGDGGSTIPGAFSFLNGASAPGDKQANAIAQQGNRTKKELMFDQQFDQYKQARDQGISKGPARQ